MDTMDRKRIKLTVNLFEEDVETLEYLSRVFGTSKTEALRRSLATQRFLVEQTVERNKEIILRGDGESVRVVMPALYPKSTSS